MEINPPFKCSCTVGFAMQKFGELQKSWKVIKVRNSLASVVNTKEENIHMRETLSCSLKEERLALNEEMLANAAALLGSGVL